MRNSNQRIRPWWREPMLWLVIGGPASVVGASLITAVIAWRGADVVLTEPAAAARVQGLQPARKPPSKARNLGSSAR